MGRGRVRRGVGRASLLVAVSMLAASLLGPVAGGGAADVRDRDRTDPSAVGRRAPWIVVIVADDMASAHLEHMPSTRRLVFERGATFARHVVNVPLCCPSRVSMFSSRYSHNTGIVTNRFPDGFHGFRTSGGERWTYAVTLRRAGYRTALLGKYLNEYPLVDSRRKFGVPVRYVPPGWTDWVVPVRGDYYGGHVYDLNADGRVTHRSGPGAYLGDLLLRRTLRLLSRQRGDRGLLLVLNVFGPHVPAPVSPVEAGDAGLREEVAGLRVPRTPDFDEADVSDKPVYVRRLARLGAEDKRRLDRTFRRQVLSSASTDRYVRRVVQTLRRVGRLDETYLVFTSDNGVHLGTHRLRFGKNTPYPADTQVPFAIRGPGIDAGTVVEQVTGNIDVAATIADLAGTHLHFRHDGESLLPLAEGRTPAAWRDHYVVRRGGLPDSGEPPHGRAPAFRGVVSTGWHYVRYRTGEQELYERAEDPYQLHNLMARDELTEEQQAALADARRALRALVDCSGVVDCRR